MIVFMITKTQKITLLAELSNLFQSTNTFQLIQSKLGDHQSIKKCLDSLISTDNYNYIYKIALSNRRKPRSNRYNVVMYQFLLYISCLVDEANITVDEKTLFDSISEKVRFMIEQNF